MRCAATFFGMEGLTDECRPHKEKSVLNELDWRLRLAGFHQICVYGDYTDEPATAAHKQWVFLTK